MDTGTKLKNINVKQTTSGVDIPDWTCLVHTHHSNGIYGLGWFFI